MNNLLLLLAVCATQVRNPWTRWLLVTLALQLHQQGSAFGTNLVKGGDASVVGALDMWDTDGDCEVSSSSRFTVRAHSQGIDRECTMTQNIDVTTYRDFQLNGRVDITLRGSLSGQPVDIASLQLNQRQCTNQQISGGNMGWITITEETYRMYTAQTRLLPNICTLKLKIEFKNLEGNGFKPSANDISVILQFTPNTLTATVAPSHLTCSVQVTRTDTATTSLSQQRSITQLTSSPSQSLSSTDDLLSTTQSVTSTGALSETGFLSVTRTVALTSSRPYRTKSIPSSVTYSLSNASTLTDTLRPTRASATATGQTLAVVPTMSDDLAVTPTPSLPSSTITESQPVQPAKEVPPMTFAARVALTSVTSAAVLIGASTAAGPATMQAVISASSCGLSNGTASAADNPALYLVSPFIGNSVLMVGGNIGLVFAFLALHVVVLLVAKRSAAGRHSPRGAAILARFPHVTLLFASMATQGVMLGGWQLAWLVLRGEDGGRAAEYMVCFVVALGAPALLLAGLWHLRVALIVPSTCSGFWASSVASRRPVEPMRVPYDELDLSSLGISRPWLLALLRTVGPTHLWNPRSHRLMFGAAIDDPRPACALQFVWPLLELWALPLLIAASSTARPHSDLRGVFCAVTMPLTALLLLVAAGAIAVCRPYRVRFKNVHRPLSLLWLALTALLSQPAVVDGLGENVVASLLAALGLLQSATLMVVIIVGCLIFILIERSGAQLFESNPRGPPISSGGSLSNDEDLVALQLCELFLGDEEMEQLNTIGGGADGYRDAALNGSYGSRSSEDSAADARLQFAFQASLDTVDDLTRCYRGLAPASPCDDGHAGIGRNDSDFVKADVDGAHAQLEENAEEEDIASTMERSTSSDGLPAELSEGDACSYPLATAGGVEVPTSPPQFLCEVAEDEPGGDKSGRSQLLYR